MPRDSGTEPASFWFGPYQLDVPARRLSRNGEVLHVSAKAFNILAVLVSRAGETVTKTELMDLVWPGVFVDEVNLAQHVSALRKLFGDSTRTPAFIATIPRSGYQFVAEVSQTGPADDRDAPSATAAGRGRFAVTMLALGAVAASVVWWLSGVGPAERDAVGSTNTEAFQAYARGRLVIRQGSGEGLPSAAAEFERAVLLDPGFARAHAELANTYVSMFLRRLIPYDDALSRAQAAASRALALDPQLSVAHVAQGVVYLQLGGSVARAVPELRQAIELDPSNALAYDVLARALRREGRFGEAVDASRHALELEPDSVRYHALLARSLLFAGEDLDEARLLCRQALPLDRASTNILELTADIEETDGQLDAAVTAWAALERARGAADLARGLEADRESFGAAESLRRYRESGLARLDADDPASGSERGRLLARLGRLDEAFEALNHASAHEFTIGLFGLKRHPAYRTLAAHPRFAELERGVSAFIETDAGQR